MRSLSALLILLVAASCVLGDMNNCQFTYQGKTYDFSSLRLE
jgi:hypothetical protein